MFLTLHIFCTDCDETIATCEYVKTSMVEGIFKLYDGLCPICGDCLLTISNQPL